MDNVTGKVTKARKKQHQQWWFEQCNETSDSELDDSSSSDDSDSSAGSRCSRPPSPSPFMDREYGGGLEGDDWYGQGGIAGDMEMENPGLDGSEGEGGSGDTDEEDYRGEYADGDVIEDWPDESEYDARSEALRTLGPIHLEEFDHMLRSTESNLTEKDRRGFRAIALKLVANLTQKGFQYLRYLYKDEDIQSEHALLARLRFLADVPIEEYDVCINSCVAFTGSLEPRSVTHCPTCGYARLAQNRRRNFMFYIPIKSSLKALQANSDTAKAMRYRSEHDSSPRDKDDLTDVFDGAHYRRLRKKKVVVDGETQNHRFFSSPVDVALGLFTDGVQLWKRSQSTVWPLFALNYNLPPERRYKNSELIPVLIMNGPSKPKEFDTFLHPLYRDAKKSARIGHYVNDGASEKPEELVVQRFYVILCGGDTPCISQWMCFKGHNGKRPCRACKIKGIWSKKGKHYYYPLRVPDIDDEDEVVSERPSFTPSDCTSPSQLARTDKEIRQQAYEVSRSPNHDTASKKTGIVGLSKISELPGIDMSCSFALDFMHEVFENIMKDLIKAWKGEFGGGADGAPWRISDREWKQLGKEITQSQKFIPYRFGRKMPDPFKHQNWFTAEDYSNFLLYIGPIVLRNRLPQRFYDHFLKLRRWVKALLSFTVSRSSLEEGGWLRREIFDWTDEYERIYYQYDAKNVQLVPYTFHVVLHIPDYALSLGPPSHSWCFVMERYAATITQLVRNRLHPYASINKGLIARYRLQIVARRYQSLHAILNPPSLPARTVTFETDTFKLRSGKRVIKLSTYERRNIAGYLNTATGETRIFSTILRKTPSEVESWGQIVFDEGRDVVYVPTLNDDDPDKAETRRDATHLIFDLLADDNENDGEAPELMRTRTCFGQLKRLFKFEWEGQTWILAMVKQAKHESFETILDPLPRFRASNAGYGAERIINCSQIRGSIGRVKDDGWFYVVDRSSEEARPVFFDDNDVDHAA